MATQFYENVYLTSEILPASPVSDPQSIASFGQVLVSYTGIQSLIFNNEL